MSKAPLEKTVPIDPQDLELDRHNPRFGGDDVAPGKRGEVTIIKRLHEQADLMELLDSIAANGYLDLEPLFIVAEGGRDVVVEGNRRVAAIKLLRDAELAKTAAIAVPSMDDQPTGTSLTRHGRGSHHCSQMVPTSSFAWAGDASIATIAANSSSPRCARDLTRASDSSSARRVSSASAKPSRFTHIR